jgi:hypothetical protein
MCHTCAKFVPDAEAGNPRDSPAPATRELEPEWYGKSGAMVAEMI